MPTHDYILSNASGASFRTDLNNALAAIVSNNSNSSEPATKYAYQWWADTSAGTLKIRNSANNAWITLFQLDGTLTLEDGSASTPALAFRDDLNTGVFSSAADKFNVATGGVERMELGATTIFNETGADVDFRIEGDTNANLFYVDASTDRIGVGISSPAHRLDVFKSEDNTTTCKFSNNGTTGGNVLKLTSGGTGAGTSIFSVFKNNQSSETEVFRVDGAGRVLVGTADASTVGSVDTNLVIGSTTNNHEVALTLNNMEGTHNRRVKFFLDDNDGVFGIDSTASTGVAPFVVRMVTGEVLRVDSSGMLSINSTSGSIGAEKLFVKNGGASANVAGFFFNNTQDRSNVMIKHDRATGGTTAVMIDFIDQTNGSSGKITSNGSNTVYDTNSDYRLKENETAIVDGITRLKLLKPYKFNFKVDPTTTYDGFFAHEVSSIVAEAITGEKDAMQPLTFYEEGDTIPSGKVVGDGKTFSETEIRPQGIDHSKLVPLLIAAVQELITKVEALEAA